MADEAPPPVPDPLDPTRLMPPGYDPKLLAATILRDKWYVKYCAIEVIQRLAREYLNLSEKLENYEKQIAELQDLNRR